jgi:hypothetical protein
LKPCWGGGAVAVWPSMVKPLEAQREGRGRGGWGGCDAKLLRYIAIVSRSLLGLICAWLLLPALMEPNKVICKTFA